MEPKLADLLREDLGADFPVASGNGKADDPLVLTELRDYVSLEYVIARHVAKQLGEEWQFLDQRLIHAGDRVIEELRFDARDVGEEEWSGGRRMFFDITAGFNARSQR